MHFATAIQIQELNWNKKIKKNGTLKSILNRAQYSPLLSNVPSGKEQETKHSELNP